MANDGISRLIAITQMKSAQANDASTQGASKQRDLIGQQKALRSAQRSLEGVLRGGLLGSLHQFHEFPRGEQASAMMELRARLQALRPTLSPAAAALLDQWIEWAGEHR